MDTVINVYVTDNQNTPVPGASVTWSGRFAGRDRTYGPVTTQGFHNQPVQIQLPSALLPDPPFVDITASYQRTSRQERVQVTPENNINTTIALPMRLTPQALHPTLYIVLAFVFGCACVIALLLIAVFIPDPTLFQQRVFLSVLALALGGVAAVISGILDVKFTLGKQLFVAATGSLAVFVLVFFFNPAVLTAQ